MVSIPKILHVLRGAVRLVTDGVRFETWALFTKPPMDLQIRHLLSRYCCRLIPFPPNRVSPTVAMNLARTRVARPQL
jgi:hypothetical protein